jgi:hypothetical protein
VIKEFKASESELFFECVKLWELDMGQFVRFFICPSLSLIFFLWIGAQLALAQGLVRDPQKHCDMAGFLGVGCYELEFARLAELSIDLAEKETRLNAYLQYIRGIERRILDLNNRLESLMESSRATSAELASERQGNVRRLKSLFSDISAERSAEILSEMPHGLAGALLAVLPDAQAVAIFNLLDTQYALKLSLLMSEPQ